MRFAREPHEGRRQGRVREIVREEVRDGIERYLNPAFLQMIREGVDQMQHIFDAVIACDEKHDELRLRIEILENTSRPACSDSNQWRCPTL